MRHFIRYGQLIPLPILLFVFGIAMLPFSSGIDLPWKSIAIDISLHLVLVFAASNFLEWRINKYPTKVLSSAHANLLAFLIAIILFLIADLFLCTLIFNDKLYLAQVDNTETMRFIMSWLCLGWVAHITVLRKHLAENNKDIELHHHAVVSLREAELFRLRQQLQPHFLYNSLNSINALIQIDQEKAQEMVGRLSDFLRLSVRRDVEEHINIQDELAYIESYLAIESVRFGNRLKIDIHKSGADWEQANMPASILQPILENAIKFGLYCNIGEVLIKIDITLRDNILFISIENPFDPSTQPPRGTGFGLEGIARRLYILYARTDLIEIKKNENVFSTLVKVPQ
ncbi:MAG: histidine kinase [Phycisphaerales bacterium]|nr:histidine kinase [Phycisphaerales bacterium]